MLVNQNMYDNLKRVATVKNRDARVAAFRQLCLQNPKIATLAQWTYHEGVKFYDFMEDADELLSEGRKSNDATYEDSPAYRGVRMLRYLCVNHSPDLPLEKRRMILRQLLSSLKSEDYDIFKSVIFERRFPFKTLGKDFVEEAIPEMFQTQETTPA